MAVDGACLTAIDLAGDRFSAEISDESLARTTLGDLKSGSKVNLERALAVGQSSSKLKRRVSSAIGKDTHAPLSFSASFCSTIACVVASSVKPSFVTTRCTG